MIAANDTADLGPISTAARLAISGEGFMLKGSFCRVEEVMPSTTGSPWDAEVLIRWNDGDRLDSFSEAMTISEFEGAIDDDRIRFPEVSGLDINIAAGDRS